MAIQDFTAGQILTAAQMDSLQANDYNWTVSNKTASYTLAATDKGTRVVMNSASATTITVNTNIFAAGDVLWIQNINSGTCTITAGTCTVNTAGSLALSQWQGGSLYFTSASTAIFFLAGGSSYGTATGGSSSSITVNGINYTLLTFTSDGNLVVSKEGLFDVLLVGGGGGSGNAAGNAEEGGGGGGSVVAAAGSAAIYLPAGTIAIDVGAGGAEATSGSVSTLMHIAARGGGFGGSRSVPTGTSGGNGGGGAYPNAAGGSGATAFTSGTINTSLNTYQGYSGGTGANDAGAGGGGGAAANGGNASGQNGGTGGNGIDISGFITGATYYAGAGGGGSGLASGGAAGNGGVAGKANGAGTGNNGVNYGAGGGGAYNNTGGSGAAGVVYVRFKV